MEDSCETTLSSDQLSFGAPRSKGLTNSRESVIEVLTSIWLRVLSRPAVGLEENFFDLEDNPGVVNKLFAEIARIFGRELPTAMIYHAPTIASLAAVLETPTTTRLPSVLLLKSGRKRPPVFLAPGLGEGVTQFCRVVKRIDSEHAIYGIEPRGIDGKEEPFDRVEDMAEYYLSAIKEVQPHGPYLLIGYSFGGVVMLEIAQHLSERGEKVALLALVESFPHPRYLRIKERVRLLMSTARDHLKVAINRGMVHGLAYMVSPAARRSRRSGKTSTDVDSEAADLSWTPAMRRMREKTYVALRRYRPRAYKDEVKFVKAAINRHFPDDPVAVWAHLIHRLEVETLPSDHHGIIRERFGDLASLVSRYVREAVSEV